MKFTKFVYAIALLGVCAPVLTSCGPTEQQQEFSFTAGLQSGKSTLETGETDRIVVYSNGVDDQNRVYTYTSSIEERATVTEEGVVTAGSQNGSVTITVKETLSNKSQKVRFNVTTPSSIASGGFNYSAAAGADAIAKRTEILGKLEKYAIDTHLTGITLFENGGYVRYNSRIDIPTNEYITGYGFGILSEGNITADLSTETTAKYKRYYHSAQTSNPNKINAWNDTGSQVSDLASYITGSYWGTKMNSTKDGYVWYPMLASDNVGNNPNNRPIPVGADNPLGLYKTWKIYVKTGDNTRATGKPLQYRYSGTASSSAFDKRDVKLEDYK
ncbi:MAG: hypothetical protein MJ236_05615, partial [Clostridia bacterium]|nr:hypothetical protein [Clostridia bacterium]